MKTSLDRIKKDIETLAAFTSTPGNGVTRLTFSSEDMDARRYIIEKMKEAGLEVREDGVGTVIGRREGLDPGAGVIMMGSHFDTVRNGGAFDGLAGVVAALEAARVMQDEGVKNVNPIEVVAMIEEEGVRFSSALLCSRAMAGKLKEEELDSFEDEDGISIRQAMEQFGIKPDLNASLRRDIKHFLELHIEQGPILESKGAQIGVVENIVALSEYRVIIKGKAGHAGTTPMELRSDALLAASHAVIAADRAAKSIGGGTVATVGKIKLLPGAVNVIPSYVELNIDIRSSNDANMEGVANEISSALKQCEADFGVKSEIERIFYNEAVRLSKEVVNIIEAEASKLGFSNMRVNSGAGHDAMVMANIAETGMIFVPSKGGISHRPDEWTDYEDLQSGAEVLLNTVLNLSRISNS